jgi:hypothetical protein
MEENVFFLSVSLNEPEATVRYQTTDRTLYCLIRWATRRISAGAAAASFVGKGYVLLQ